MTSWITDRVFTDRKDSTTKKPKKESAASMAPKKNGKRKKNELHLSAAPALVSGKNLTPSRPTRNPASSLIRRARLIRRRTTNKYCENMRNIAEEETPIIMQMLCLRLKPCSAATEQEIRKLNGLKSAFVPYVEHAVPEITSLNDHKFPAFLFFPDFTQNPYLRPQGDKVCQYTVILTDEKGNRTYAYCFKYQLNVNSRNQNFDSKLDTDPLNYGVVVLTSAFPVENLLKGMVDDFIRNLRRDPSCFAEIAADLMHLRLTQNSDSIKSSHFVVSNHRGCMYANNPAVALIEKFGVENTVFVFLSLLAEKRVIVTGSDVVAITEAVQGFVKLLSPLDWPHTLIPIVPDTHVDLAYNPTPYIIGIMRYNLNKLKDIICPMIGSDNCEDVTIIDLERGVVMPSLPLEAIQNPETKLKALVNAGRQMGFPKKVTIELVGMLKLLFPRKCAEEKFGLKIERKIMIWYAQLFGHYRIFATDSSFLTTKNKKLIVSVHPVPEIREFLQWFIESGIFQAFLYTEQSSKYRNKTMYQFYEILDRHSPPMKGKSKSDKARTLMWRLFH